MTCEKEKSKSEAPNILSKKNENLVKKMIKGKINFILSRGIINRPSRCAGIVFVKSEKYPDYCL